MPTNLMTAEDVAAYSGLSAAAVRMRLHRRTMPEPVAYVGQSPVWTRAQVDAWTGGPGRKPPRAPRSDAGTTRKGETT